MERAKRLASRLLWQLKRAELELPSAEQATKNLVYLGRIADGETKAWLAKRLAAVAKREVASVNSAPPPPGVDPGLRVRPHFPDEKGKGGRWVDGLTAGLRPQVAGGRGAGVGGRGAGSGRPPCPLPRPPPGAHVQTGYPLRIHDYAYTLICRLITNLLTYFLAYLLTDLLTHLVKSDA